MDADVKVINQELMWPTPYWEVQIPEFIRSKTEVTFNEDMVNWVHGQMDKEESVIKSNRGGWQSNLQKPEGIFTPLVKQISGFCGHLPLGIKQINIFQLWVSVNKRNDWNVIHQHGQYHLTGTYYVKVPKDSGSIVFRDPRPGALCNMFVSRRFDKGEFRKINLLEGLLMIWPPYLEHFVEPSQTDEERISISFDIVAN